MFAKSDPKESKAKHKQPTNRRKKYTCENLLKLYKQRKALDQIRSVHALSE